MGVKGLTPKELEDRLMRDYKIFTIAINRGIVQGCRITPNVYTTTRELDSLVKTLIEINKSLN